MDRKSQQSDLIYQLGLLLSPLQDVADHPDHYDDHSKAQARAKFTADLGKFLQNVRSFTIGEPGLEYTTEYERVHQAMHAMKKAAWKHIDAPGTFPDLLKQYRTIASDAIMLIPVTPSSEIFEAHTPFSTYCALKDLCQTVSRRLIIIDPYLDVSVFSRYLRDIPDNVQVTLLTNPGRTQEREFSEISRVYAAERGPDKYRLIVHQGTRQEKLHDRFLCFDDEIYQLGGSIKDAGRKSDFTLSKMDPKNFPEIDRLIESGTEIFGPNQPAYP